MEKEDVKIYHVHVHGKEYNGNAHLICVTYSISQSLKAYGTEFYLYYSSFELRNIQIPFSQALTFKQELLSYWTSAGIAPKNREKIEKWIEEKMKETFGENIIVITEEINKINNI